MERFVGDLGYRLAAVFEVLAEPLLRFSEAPLSTIMVVFWLRV